MQSTTYSTDQRDILLQAMKTRIPMPCGMGRDQEEQTVAHGGTELAHFKNFIDCVTSRNKANLNAPIEEGHISCALVHLANASYRLGRTINFNPDTQQVIGDEEAQRLLCDGDRGYRAPFVVPEEV